MVNTKETTISTRIDPQIKCEAEKILHSMGLNMSTFLRMVVSYVAKEKSLPFEMKPSNEMIKTRRPKLKTKAIKISFINF